MMLPRPLLLVPFVAIGCAVEPAAPADDERAAEVAVSASAVYELEVKHSGKVLDVAAASTADGANVQQWHRNGTAAQRFRFEPVAGGYYVVRAVVSGKVLDVKDQSTAEGANVQQWSSWGGPNQQWSVEDAGSGYVYLRARHSGMVLDVAWAGAADGTNVAVVKHYRSDAQKWKLVPVAATAPTPTPTTPATGALPTRLRIVNRCAEPVWIAHSDNVPDAQNLRLQNGEWHDYAIPDGGLSATRFWPKTGCDASGHACRIGDSGEGGGKPCPATGCQPPVDSKFEATFAPKGSAAQTWYNLSQVDGYTLPFAVTPRGPGAGVGSCVSSDCSRLSLDRCPGAEDLGAGFSGQDLRVRDASGRVIACLSPCKRWNYPAPYGLGKPESVDPGLHLCCPTPIDPSTGGCSIDRSCMTSAACSNGADPLGVVRTRYVAAMREMCPSAYSYAYDDAAGLHACSSQTQFEVVFCP